MDKGLFTYFRQTILLIANNQDMPLSSSFHVDFRFLPGSIEVHMVFFQDRYVLATIVMLTLICCWHGLQTVIPNSSELDLCMVVVFGGGYTIYNLQFFFKLALGVSDITIFIIFQCAHFISVVVKRRLYNAFIYDG